MAEIPIFGSAARSQWEAQELRQATIQKLVGALLVGSGLAWTTVGAVGPFDRARFNLFVIIFFMSLLLLFANRYSYLITCSLLFIGPLSCFVLALCTVHHPLVPAFASLIVVANAIVSPWLGLAAASLSSACLWIWGPRSSLAAALALVWATVVLQTIITHGLYTALKWSSESQQRAAELLAEARSRRGELRRTLDSLTEATRRLERTRYELVIARQQAEEARHIKAQFAANISHELRTPLNLMIGFSEMMYRTPEVYGQVTWTPALRADIREIHRSARHLMGMVDDILDLARVEAGRLPLRLEQTDLAELVCEATNIIGNLAREKPIELQIQVAPDLPRLMIDRARIRQVLINLLNNAVRFTDRGRITISAHGEPGLVVIAVRDTGVGIPEDQLGVIFEEFGQATGPITSGRGGIGLGLAICQQFVRLHGGTISAESKEGVGSVFRFTLPLRDSTSASPHMAYYAPEAWSPRVPENPMGKCAILLAPEQGDLIVARDIEGYRTLPISRLDELAELVESEHPAGIVMLHDPFLPRDTLPEEVWQATGRQDMPIVSCEVPMSALVRGTLGINATLSKPLGRDELTRIVRRHAPHPDACLLVDDDAGFSALLARMLTSEFPNARIYRAHTGHEATELLERHACDVVFLDLALGEENGIELLSGWREKTLLGNAAVILTTGVSYEEIVLRLRPSRIEVVRNHGYGQMGRYVSALLDVAPPNYSTTTAPTQRGETS